MSCTCAAALRAHVVALAALLGTGCDAVSVVGFVEGTAPATDPSVGCPAGSLLLGCTEGNACGGHLLTDEGRTGSASIAVDDEMRVFHIVDGADGLEDIVSFAPDEAQRVVAAGISQVMDLEVDETHLYWLPHNGDVYRAPKDGSGSTDVVDLPLGNGRKLALAGARAYATVLREGEDDVQGDVAVFAKDGSGEVVTVPQPAPWALAATESAVFWSNDGFGAGAGEIVGGPPELLGAAALSTGLVPPHSITIARDYIVWVTDGEESEGGEEGVLMRAPIAGGPAELLADGIYKPKAVGFFEGMIYVATGGGLLGFPLDGGAPKELWANGVLSLEVRCSGVYAQHWDDGGIVRYGR
ncbi:MAG: hypothetical protein WKG00_35995 [Polyangiaceae bacterium]